MAAHTPCSCCGGSGIVPNATYETHNTREGEKLEELINNIRRHPDTDSVHIHELFHQELQKARQDWLREEIVKLEGMRNDDLPSTLKDPVGFCKGIGHNKVLQTIIDRYQSELDHPTK